MYMNKYYKDADKHFYIAQITVVNIKVGHSAKREITGHVWKNKSA